MTGPWTGIRWQLSFTAPGVPRRRLVDATTTPEGHAWAVEVARRLQDVGHIARLGQDEGADAHGAPVMYDEINVVSVEEGYLALAFFADEVCWTVDIAPDQCTQGLAEQAVRDVCAIVETVTGYVLQTAALTPAERALLGHEPGAGLVDDAGE